MILIFAFLLLSFLVIGIHWFASMIRMFIILGRNSKPSKEFLEKKGLYYTNDGQIRRFSWKESQKLLMEFSEDLTVKFKREKDRIKIKKIAEKLHYKIIELFLAAITILLASIVSMTI